ncbi:CRE-GRO-1 protein [Caenorhabditis remanei]|uniref:CRE-GRO-1 protein n=1 Tax=Caenorhabditis remanei TaxID=31234 RepID=E3MY48_CAERE|nr:CRE-GRO-1 protein [Caenorhabditis remanei]
MLIRRILQFLTPAIRKMRKEPIIFVIGCTGTGKSDLGVAIAKKYGGEVISVDSMQFYRGLDIATNKITEEESEGVPHHMMSFLNPSDSATYNVHQFKEATLDLIQKIRARSRIPIIVGGTTYYAESVLYENNLIETTSKSRTSSESSSDDVAPDDVTVTNEELWAELRKVDEKSALLLHPNNRYRVLRALQIYKETGVPKSEFVEKQKSDESVDLGGRLRFDDSLVIYMDATPEVLEERLDGRVDKMIRMGLKRELSEFYQEHHDFIHHNKYGVMQCIGLKEFVPWLSLDPSDRESPLGEKLFKQGCDDVKLHTRQYARRQRRWYRSRLLIRSEGDRKMASTKMLDTSDKSKIISDGMEIADRWMSGVDLFEDISTEQVVKGVDSNVLLTCEICGISMTGRDNWQKHIAGKKHKHNAKQSKSEGNLE